tara:strand:+ start:54 stop:413 length:360 start_codon:yes stop_codon:yes gene_type:complete
MSNLAKRAIACKGWRWMPGMLQVVAPKQDGGTGCVVRYEGIAIPGAYPDLSDPATMGCLLSLVREAWGCPTAYLVHSDGLWILMRRDPMALALCRPQMTETEALVAALEAAERQEVKDE